jgi:hypothetical protein
LPADAWHFFPHPSRDGAIMACRTDASADRLRSFHKLCARRCGTTAIFPRPSRSCWRVCVRMLWH